MSETKGHGRPRDKVQIGDNGPTEEERRYAIREMLRLNAERDQVSVRRSAYRKKLKGAGHTLGHIDRTIKRLMQTKAEVRADQIDEAKYLLSVNLPAGEFLDQFEPDDNEGESLYQARIWYERGRTDGMVGKGWAESPPDGCPPENAPDYARGHEAADKEVQADWLKRQQAMPPPVETAANDEADSDEEFEDDFAAAE